MKKRLLKLACLLFALAALLTGCWEEPPMDTAVVPAGDEEIGRAHV